MFRGFQGVSCINLGGPTLPNHSVFHTLLLCLSMSKPSQSDLSNVLSKTSTMLCPSDVLIPQRQTLIHRRTPPPCSTLCLYWFAMVAGRRVHRGRFWTPCQPQFATYRLQKHLAVGGEKQERASKEAAFCRLNCKCVDIFLSRLSSEFSKKMQTCFWSVAIQLVINTDWN